MNKRIPSGTVHQLPADLGKALLASHTSLSAWYDITPLARNEWICWVESAKLIDTRDRRIERTCTELSEGKRRPCCWIGCVHRPDKEMSPSVRRVLEKQSKKKKP